MEEQKIEQNQNNINAEDKNVEIRTMQSDLKSMENGEPIKPYNPEVSQEENQESINLQNLDTGSNASVENQVTSSPQVQQGEEKKKNFLNSKKGLVIGLISFVLIVGIAALGYFVVYPLISPSSSTQNENQNEVSISVPPLPQPSNETGEASIETPPMGETSTLNEEMNATTSKETSSQKETNTSTSTSTSTNNESQKETFEHVSPFSKVDATVTTKEVLKGSNIESIQISNPQTSSLIEVVFETSSQITFSKIMKTLWDIDLTKSGLDKAFDESYTTAFIYIEKDGTKKIGYVAKLNSTSDLVDEKRSLGQIIESNVNLKNIFSKDPGSIQGWKNGSSNASLHRYTLFSKSGYSIDYGWKDNFFIISSSFEGFKAVLENIK